MKNWKRMIGLSLPAAACLSLGTGCQPDAVFPLNSTEGQTLNKMLTEGREVKADVPEGLPVSFEPVSIERLDDWFYGRWISGRLAWKWTLPYEQLDAALRRFAKKQEDAPIAGVWVKLEYLDADGKVIADETLTLNPILNTGMRVKLYKFGRGGEPVRIRATVIDVSFARPVAEIPPAAEEPARTPAPAVEPDGGG